MNERENTLRTIRFEGPQWIPVQFDFNGSCWHHYDEQDLFDLMEQHRRLFPNFKRPEGPSEPHIAPWQLEHKPYRDAWGSVWETTDQGVTGAVTEHPLEQWDQFAQYLPPDPATTKGGLPEGSLDWEEIARHVRIQKEQQRFTAGTLPHGHTFLRLTYLRGYENVILDMADDDSRLRELLGMVESFNLYLVRRYVNMGVDQMGYPEDLGMQQGPMLSPDQFRTYIKPSFERIMKPARDAGCLLHMHSDGDVRELTDDLLALGINTLNIQDLVNGVDWVRDNLKGRVCIDLDIDRQNIVRFGTAQDVKDLVREEVEKLSSPAGGLMMHVDIYPGIPLENLRALMDALEEHMTNK